MTMTLEQVRDCLRAAQNHGLCVVTSHEAKQLADAIGAHLAAAQEVIELLRFRDHGWALSLADKLEAAIKGEP